MNQTIIDRETKIFCLKMVIHDKYYSFDKKFEALKKLIRLEGRTTVEKNRL